MNFQNAKTGHFYSPKNQQELLDSAEDNGFESEKVAGFRQWLELGRQVSKGQKSTKIMMVVEKKYEKADGDEGKRKVVKTISVFFEDQTEAVKATA